MTIRATATTIGATATFGIATLATPNNRDPRDVFMRDLDLPRGLERQRVIDDRDREYTLRGSETRTLSTVGAFRVVPARDLRDHRDRAADPREGDLRHLRESRLIETVRMDGRRDVAVVLTQRGRDLLESHRRDRSHDHQHEHRLPAFAPAALRGGTADGPPPRFGATAFAGLPAVRRRRFAAMADNLRVSNAREHEAGLPTVARFASWASEAGAEAGI